MITWTARRRCSLLAMPVTARSSHCFRREVDFRAEIEKERDELPESSPSAAAGWSATCSASDGGRVGAHVWSYVAGHAVDESRARCATSMPRRRRLGRGRPGTAHFFYVPATALPQLVDPWFRLWFGACLGARVRESRREAPVNETSPGARARPTTFGSGALDASDASGEHQVPARLSSTSRDDEPTRVEEWADTWSSRRPAVTSSPSATGRSSATSCSTAGRMTSACRSTRSTSPRPRPGRASGGRVSASRSPTTCSAGRTSRATRP